MTISIESLLRNSERLFLPSPCVLRSYKVGVARHFDRNAPDAERVLREVFTAHFGPYSPHVDAWVDWCMDEHLPRHSDSRVAKDRGQQIYDWGAMFEAA